MTPDGGIIWRWGWGSLAIFIKSSEKQSWFLIIDVFSSSHWSKLSTPSLLVTICCKFVNLGSFDICNFFCPWSLDSFNSSTYVCLFGELRWRIWLGGLSLLVLPDRLTRATGSGWHGFMGIVKLSSFNYGWEKWHCDSCSSRGSRVERQGGYPWNISLAWAGRLEAVFNTDVIYTQTQVHCLPLLN